MAGLTLGVWLGRKDRSAGAKPWNSTSFTTQYEGASSEGPRNNLTLFYAVSNNTDSDYDLRNARISFNIRRTRARSPIEVNDYLQNLPRFIPAHRTARVEIRTRFETLCPQPPLKTTAKARDEYESCLKTFLHDPDVFGKADGFVLFDPERRLEIVFSPTWKENN